MERENRKRGREEGEDKKDSYNSVVKTARKQQQDLHHHHQLQQQQQQHCDSNHINFQDRSGSSSQINEGESYVSSDNYLALGVFDFPWLHDEGMISKSEEWNIEDIFASSLGDTCIEAEVEFSKQFLYETPTTTSTLISSSSSSFAVEENVWQPMKGGEDGLEMDCIWSSLLNQPLSTGRA